MSSNSIDKTDDQLPKYEQLLQRQRDLNADFLKVNKENVTLIQENGALWRENYVLKYDCAVMALELSMIKFKADFDSISINSKCYDDDLDPSGLEELIEKLREKKDAQPQQSTQSPKLSNNVPAEYNPLENALKEYTNKMAENKKEVSNEPLPKCTKHNPCRIADGCPFVIANKHYMLLKNSVK